jgi:predicted ATPase/DNA-binding CsgD family transcriptional regulator
MEKGWNLILPDADGGAEKVLDEELTQREGDILELLAAGHSNREIADRLTLSINTVKWYARQVYDKLGVENRRQAAQRARGLGLVGSPTRKGQIPTPPTDLLGREEEIEEIVRRIAAQETRLLTLTGLGGIGKSRLAVEVARILSAERRGTFRDGVFFVALAALTNPEGIVLSIGDVLGLVLQPGGEAAKHQLIEHLAPRRLLLVLDNFEHLAEGVGLIDEILAASQYAKIMVTSREPLGLQAEWRFELSGLQYPEHEPLADLESFPSVQLFLDRARRQGSTLSSDPPELRSVARICQLVEGMPLAIELAAAWVHTLSSEEIALEIEGGLDLLRTEFRDIPERQRSVRAVFERSWVRMAADEREALARLSVFSGGFSRRAAVDVAGASVHQLASLLQKSLVRRGASDRYEMHELVKQFSRSKLSQMGIQDKTHLNHSSFYAGRLRELQSGLRGDGQAAALDEIASEFDNLREAWNWAIRRKELGLIDGMLQPLYLYAIFRRGRIDGDTMLKDALAALSEPTGDAARALHARLLARCEMIHIDMARSKDRREVEEAKQGIVDALSVAREREDLFEIMFCLNGVGRADMWLNNLGLARSTLEDALKMAERLHEEFYQAYILFRLGLCSVFMGDREASLRYSRKGLEIARKTGNLYVAAWCLSTIGTRLAKAGELASAIESHREAIRIHDELGDRQGSVWDKAFLALDHFYEGEFQRANRICRGALAEAREISHPGTLGMVLAIYSRIQVEVNDVQGAIRSAEEALPLTEARPLGPGAARFGLAYATCIDGDPQVVREHITYAIPYFYRFFGYIGDTLGCLAVVGMLLAREDRFRRATELLGLIESHPSRPAGWLDRSWIVAELRDRLSSALDDEAYRRAWEQGSRLELDSVMANITGGKLWPQETAAPED